MKTRFPKLAVLRVVKSEPLGWDPRYQYFSQRISGDSYVKTDLKITDLQDWKFETKDRLEYVYRKQSCIT